VSWDSCEGAHHPQCERDCGGEVKYAARTGKRLTRDNHITGLVFYIFNLLFNGIATGK